MTSGRSKRVLVADDSLTARMFVCEVLEGGGYDVIAAKDGTEALALATEAFADSGLDLLVTDVLMPGLKGPDLARRLIADRAGFKVILISGFTGEEALDDLLRENGARFLQKPVSPTVLLDAVVELIGEATSGDGA